MAPRIHFLLMLTLMLTATQFSRAQNGLDKCREFYLLVGWDCGTFPNACPPGSTCECRTEQCRLMPNEKGCGQDDNKCAGSATCMYNYCRSPRRCDEEGGYSPHCSDNNRCLKVVPDRVTFSQASSYCQDDHKGGRLMTLMTEDDLDCLALASQEGLLADNENYWLGADDIMEEGKYTWHDCYPMNLSHPNWGEDQPNHLEGEDCIDLDHTDFRLHDYPCNFQFAFICEYLLSPHMYG